ncbi:TPA: DEAD/DEAH box helicase [Enterococcus faecium]
MVIIISYFSDLYNEIQYPISTNLQSGLRNAQIGAIHSIASNATLDNTGSSIIVMPTGSGKTTVLMMAPYVLRKRKVLIVTPSALVRGQIAEDYSKLATLKDIGVFSSGIKPPIIFESKKMYSEEHDLSINESDVVIATHKVAVSISEQTLSKSFDYIVIDEAHHVPAASWQKILMNMSGIPSLLVTATPFRLDRKEIKGKQIYNYPLSRAYKDGIFGEIIFNSIEEAPDKDRLIALEAERVFLNDGEQGYDHYMVVRTDTKKKAQELEKLYREITNLKLKRIDSSMSYKTVKKALEDLKNKNLDGIVCVDMLGEGFDFPNLKIAAIHEPQKSLASTLQFIGRFARTNAKNIGSATFIAMNDENLKIGNKKLYSSDSAWQDMIINISEEKIEGQIENQEIISQFSKPESEDEIIPLNRIRPNFHAKVYEVQDFDIDGKFPEELSIEDNIYINIETNTIIGISRLYTVPLWLEGNIAVNKELGLYIVHFQEKTNLLFIYAHTKTEATYELIAECFTTKHTKIPRNEMHRVLADYENYEFFNTGMQNRYAESGESYRIYAGSNTASSIDENTGKMQSAGHAFCKVSKAGEELTVGYSSGSKVWSQVYLNIPDYIKWCDTFGEKISNSLLRVKTNTNYDKLPLSERILHYEKDIIFAFLPENVYSSPGLITSIVDNNKKALITDIDLKVKNVDDAYGKIYFQVEIFNETEVLTCDITGTYGSEERKFKCIDGRNEYYLSDFFNENPISFKSINDTVYSGHEMLKGNLELEKFDKNRIIPLNWSELNVDTSLEFGFNDKTGEISIQDGLREWLLTEKNVSHIFFDHSTGEIADFITFNTSNSHIEVELYHCKSQRGKNYNSRLEDVYEVSQQAVKCTRWLKNKAELVNKIDYRNRKTKNSEFIKGDFATFKALMKSTRSLKSTVYIVQPGVSKSSYMGEEFGTVLSSANSFIKNSGRVGKLLILGSE